MLTDEDVSRICLAWDAEAGVSHADLMRAVEAEVRKQDDTLILQLLEALSLPCDRWNGAQAKIVTAAIDAAHQRLEGKP